MNILDELLEAKGEFLQDLWDQHIIDCWKTKSHWNMGRVIRVFMLENKIKEKDFYQLKRIPRFDRHYKCTITRYISAYLPLLNTHLWNNNKTEDELIKICSRMNIMNYPSDQNKVQKESHDLSRSKNQYRRAIAERDSYDIFKEKANRSNWGAVKK